MLFGNLAEECHEWVGVEVEIQSWVAALLKDSIVDGTRQACGPTIVATGQPVDIPDPLAEQCIESRT